MSASTRKDYYDAPYDGLTWPRPPGRIGAPSLFQVATANLLRNIHRIDDFGSLDAKYFRHIVKKAPSAAVLAQWENAHPEIRGENVDLWKRFIRQGGLNADPEDHVPKDPKNWSRVYQKLRAEKDAADQRAVEQLQASLQAQKKAHDARFHGIIAPQFSRSNRSILNKLHKPVVPDRSRKILATARPTTLIGRDSMTKRVKDDPLDMAARKAAKRKREEARLQAERERLERTSEAAANDLFGEEEAGSRSGVVTGSSKGSRLAGPPKRRSTESVIADDSPSPIKRARTDNMPRMVGFATSSIITRPKASTTSTRLFGRKT